MWQEGQLVSRQWLENTVQAVAGDYHLPVVETLPVRNGDRLGLTMISTITKVLDGGVTEERTLSNT